MPGGPERWRWIGWLLLLPMVALWVVTMVVPALRVVVLTFSPVAVTGRDGSGGNGWAEAMRHGELSSALLHNVVYALVPMLAMVLLAPALAIAVHRAGRWMRLAARVVLTVPLVCFAPFVVTMVAFFGMRAFAPRPLSVPYLELAPIGATVALGVFAYLAVLRRQEADAALLPPGRPRTDWRAFCVIGGIGTLGVVAAAFQAYGPYLSTGVPGIGSLMRIQIEAFAPEGAAATGTTVGLLVGAVGLAATVLVILGRIRIELAPAKPGRRPVGPLGTFAPPARPAGAPVGRIVLGLALLVFVLLTFGYTHLPWFVSLPVGSADISHPLRELLGTWAPPLIAVLVQVPIAYLAGVGIGALRPLGRRSELLLLPFGPWLFATLIPLFPLEFIGRGHPSWFGLVPTILIAVPAMFVFTVFGRGQGARWREMCAAGVPVGVAFRRTLLRPLLPAAGLLALAGLVIGAQDAYLPSVTVRNDDSALMGLFRAMEVSYGSSSPVALATPPPLIALLFAVGVLAQVWYLDRLAIRTGPDTVRVAGSMPGPPAGPGGPAARPGWPGGGPGSGRPGMGPSLGGPPPPA